MESISQVINGGGINKSEVEVHFQRARVLAIATTPTKNAGPDSVCQHEPVPKTRSSRTTAAAPIAMADQRSHHGFPYCAVAKLRSKARHIRVLRYVANKLHDVRGCMP